MTWTSMCSKLTLFSTHWRSGKVKVRVAALACETEGAALTKPLAIPATSTVWSRIEP